MTAEPDLLAADVQARSDALDISRSFIVQAPAGSGKTELLIQRYLSLLGAVAEPEEILAITFTRKAAAEMLVRVLDALRSARNGTAPTEPHRKLTWKLARRALRRSEKRSWNLIGSPRRMRIQTLDSLNGMIARARPLSSADSNVGARIARDAGLKAIHEAAAVATLDWLAESGPVADAAHEILSHFDNNTRAYVSHVAAMLRTRDQWLPFVGSGLLPETAYDALRKRLEDSLQFAIGEHLQRLRARMADGSLDDLPPLFDYAASNLARDGVDDSPVVRLEGVNAWPATEPDSVPLWAAIAELLLVRNGAAFRRTVTKGQGFPTADRAKKDTVCEILATLQNDTQLAELLHGTRLLPPAHYTDAQWSVLLALFRLLPLAASELKRLFAERGMTDDIEVALQAGAALGSAEDPGDIALLLDYGVQHILVDEMQDTSSAQYRMLEALTGGWALGDGRSLFCVGDPMQSIYRFRNAEVGEFLLAREFGIGRLQLDSLVLRRNFRSGSGLVDWFNAVFPAVLAENNDALHGAVAYSPSVPAPQLEGYGDVHVHPVFGSDPGEEAVTGCRVVRELLDAHPEEGVAVLVRGRTQLPDLLAAFREAGIAYAALDIDKLTDLPEIIDVLALTRAAVHAGDRVGWLGLLRAPWIGLSWSDLHALVHSDTSSTVPELLEDESRIAAMSAEGQAALRHSRDVLAHLLRPRRSASLRQRVEECWFALGGPGALRDAAEIDNVYRYFDLLEAQESGGTLPDVAMLESILEDEKVSGTQRARVQVMTMHRAKGLEFDHVVLYGLGRKPGGGGSEVLSWFDLPSPADEPRRIISPIGARADVERDPVHRYIAAVTARKDAYEQGRLLYVACTRAQRSLHLVANVAVAADGNEYRPARKDSLLHLLWPALEPDFARAFDARPDTVDVAAVPTWIEPVLHRFTEAWRLPKAPQLAGDRQADKVSPQDDAVEFYWVGTEARIAGTIVHRWLQLVADGRIELDALPPETRERITRRWLREAGLDEERQDGIVERAIRTLERVRLDPRGRWLLGGEGHAELALTGYHDGAVESIVVDRIRIDEDGTHWLVDYKTSTHEGGDLEGFLQAEVTRYRPQLTRYAAIYGAWAGVTPRCALYFPLLGEFVEL